MSAATRSPITFDSESGRLRLDADTFIALGELDGTPAPDRDATFDALRHAGAVVDNEPHVSLRPGLAAVTRPIARLELVSSGHDHVLLHQGWLSLISAVLADVGDGSYDFASVATDFVPTVVARLTRFGPRPRLAPGAVPVTEDTLDGLLNLDDDARRSAVAAVARGARAEWADVAGEIEAQRWHFWFAEVSWPLPGGHEAASHRLAVFDTEAGLLTLEGGDETGKGLALVPTTPAHIWLMLSSILPSDAELTPA